MDNSLPIVTCREEGGLYSPARDPHAPIRIYPDGSIKDDYYGGERERVSADDLERIIAVARTNRARGLV